MLIKEPELEHRSGLRVERAQMGWRVRVARAGLVVLGLGAWFGTQSLIGSRKAATGFLPIEADGVLKALSGVNAYLWDPAHAWARNGLLISSSAVIDVLAIFILLRAIFGPSVRPFLGLLIVFGLRQIFQALCLLPMPEGMIWPKEGPGFPSLLVTYGVSNDLFFSGHTALAVFGAVELARVKKGGGWLVPVGVAIAVFEAVAVLALRAHWTMDVYAGAVTALLVAVLAGRIAPAVDRGIGRAVGDTKGLT